MSMQELQLLQKLKTTQNEEAMAISELKEALES